MTLLLVLHLLALGLWIGCIATETVFEHRLGKEPGQLPAVARLHVAVDLWIEVPAFLAVLASGTMLALQVPLTPLLAAKIASGFVAILTNAACVWIVIARDRAFRAGAKAEALRLDLWQHRSGGLLVVVIALTLVLAAFLP